MTYGNHKNPLVGPPHGFYVVVETSGSNEDHDQQKMTSFLEEAMEKSLVEDGTLATDSVKFQVCLSHKFVTGIFKENSE